MWSQRHTNVGTVGLPTDFPQAVPNGIGAYSVAKGYTKSPGSLNGSTKLILQMDQENVSVLFT